MWNSIEARSFHFFQKPQAPGPALRRRRKESCATHRAAGLTQVRSLAFCQSATQILSDYVGRSDSEACQRRSITQQAVGGAPFAATRSSVSSARKMMCSDDQTFNRIKIQSRTAAHNCFGTDRSPVRLKMRKGDQQNPMQQNFPQAGIVGLQNITFPQGDCPGYYASDLCSSST